MKKTDLDPNPSLAVPTIPVICDRCRNEGAIGDPAFAGVADILNFQPVPRRAQVNSWTAEHQRAFIAAVAITGSARKAAATIGRHVYGADLLRKSRGGRSFADAWEAALEIAREREIMRISENLSELRTSSEAEQARGGGGGGDGGGSGDGYSEPGGTWEGGMIGGDFYGADEGEAAQYRQARDAVRDKLLKARRLLLAIISSNPEMRSAWEVLVDEVDWAKAERMEPQDNEPFGIPNMRKADMIITAEWGLLHDVIGDGPNLQSELRGMLEEENAKRAAEGEENSSPDTL